MVLCLTLLLQVSDGGSYDSGSFILSGFSSFMDFIDSIFYSLGSNVGYFEEILDSDFNGSISFSSMIGSSIIFSSDLTEWTLGSFSVFTSSVTDFYSY